jgi:uncharacterized membrane protein YphA (DoxX/SURF4 family)
MFQTVEDSNSKLSDWMFRISFALFFVIFGLDKFPAHGSWVKFFQDLGWGQWFRYFTGWVEVAGGVLVLIPWTVTAGLALLACTMAGAAGIWIFIFRQPANSIFSGVFLIALTMFWWTRRTRTL